MRSTSIVPILLAVPASAMLMGDSCGGSSNPDTTPAAGGTGAFGIVTVGGVQKLYLPTTLSTPMGHGQIQVVNAGLPGNGAKGANALITGIDLGTTEMATTTAGNASVVVAASKDNNKVFLIDPSKDTLTKTLTLDATDGQSSFSGGGGYVTGIAMDTAHHRAILSVWNGFAVLDLTSQSFTSVILVPPTENFGFDSTHQRILAPFYDCSSSADSMGQPPPFCGNYSDLDGGPMTDGLNVIDLTDNTVYTYQDPTAMDPNMPVGFHPDSAAVDPSTGVAVVPSEGDYFQTVIDFSKATFDKGRKTVTAPHQVLKDVDFDGVAVEPVGHFAFWEQEFSPLVAVVDLNQANAGHGNVVQSSMPPQPDGIDWLNIGDPHGIAVTTGISSGRSVGFLVNDNWDWVARIDLATFSGMNSDGGPVDLTPALTYLAVKK